jgi:asparagine synthase (glutamine-hydrolysing)
VVLDGQGADEQLCGYRKYSYFLLRELIRRGRWKKAIAQAVAMAGAWRYFKGVDVRHSMRYFGRSPQSIFVRKRLFRSAMAERFEMSPPMGDLGSMARRIKADITRFSLPSLLRYEDKNAMAFGVESRTPYLDYRVVSFLADLPISAKIDRSWTKVILRLAAAGLIPEKIRLRRDKLAFDTPQDRWLRRFLAEDVAAAYRRDGLLARVFDTERLTAAFRQFCAADPTPLSGHLFFRAFILQRWSQLFL